MIKINIRIFILFLVIITISNCKKETHNTSISEKTLICGDIHSDGKDYQIELDVNQLKNLKPWEIGTPLPFSIDASISKVTKTFKHYTTDTSKWFVGGFELTHLYGYKDIWYYIVKYYRKDENSETKRIQYMHLPVFFDSVSFSIVPINYK